MQRKIQNHCRTAPPRISVTNWVCIGSLLILAGLAGCHSLDLNPTAPVASSAANPVAKNNARPTPGKDLRIAGSGLMLGKTDNVAFEDHEFAKILSGLLQEQKLATVKHLVRTYPDITMSLMMNGPCDELDFGHTRQVAEIVDITWNRNAAGTGAWETYIELCASQDGENSFHALRRQHLELLTNNSPKAALDLGLTKRARESGSEIALLEAIRLEATAHSLAGNYRQCIQSIESILVRAGDQFPVQASRMLLLIADASRHLGNMELCSANWSRATELESQTMKSRGFHDPAFWKQAAFQRPVDSDWPAPVVANIREVLDRSGLQYPDSLHNDSCRESILWALVGVQSLKRHESQNAILAFKKAEGLVATKDLKNELLLQQALSMLDAGQAGPASAILFRLTTESGLIASRSRGILGSLKLQHGSIEQGLNLLTSAIPSADRWPLDEKLRAQSDLALATLIRTEESAGMDMLEDTILQFVDRGLFGDTVQALTNIARYYETKKNVSQHTHALQRLQEFESSGIISPSS